jgi:AcrR family transcriptional regulator
MAANRRPLRRETVLAAARRRVARHGLAGLSLRQVARDLGVTAPALYAHVESKEALVRALADNELTRLAARLEAVDDPDPLERIRGMSRAYVAHARTHPELFSLMFAFRPDWVPVPEVEELPAASKAFGVAAAAVEEAIATGRFAPVDPLTAALSLWTATHGVAVLLTAGPGLGDDAERRLVDDVLGVVLAGLAAR